MPSSGVDLSGRLHTYGMFVHSARDVRQGFSLVWFGLGYQAAYKSIIKICIANTSVE